MAKSYPVRDYITNVLNGMAWGLFSSLLIGLIIKQIGTLAGLEILVDIGNVAQRLMGPAIGVGVAYVLRAPALVVMSCATVGISVEATCDAEVSPEGLAAVLFSVSASSEDEQAARAVAAPRATTAALSLKDFTNTPHVGDRGLSLLL